MGESVVRELVDHGARIITSSWPTALWSALAHGQFDIANFFIDELIRRRHLHGVKIALNVQMDGMNALMRALGSSDRASAITEDERIEMASRLLELGAGI